MKKLILIVLATTLLATGASMARAESSPTPRTTRTWNINAYSGSGDSGNVNVRNDALAQQAVIHCSEYSSQPEDQGIYFSSEQFVKTTQVISRGSTYVTFRKPLLTHNDFEVRYSTMGKNRVIANGDIEI